MVAGIIPDYSPSRQINGKSRVGFPGTHPVFSKVSSPSQGHGGPRVSTGEGNKFSPCPLPLPKKMQRLFSLPFDLKNAWSAQAFCMFGQIRTQSHGEHGVSPGGDPYFLCALCASVRKCDGFCPFCWILENACGRRLRGLTPSFSPRTIEAHRAGVAELADAGDSKSPGVHPPCGFDSHLRHHHQDGSLRGRPGFFIPLAEEAHEHPLDRYS